MRVELTRGDVVESVHHVDVVIADRSGSAVVWGDADRAVIPRSSIKFVQALPLLATGAADRFDLTDVELALACSSHSGEAAHVDAVRSWLDRIGCAEADLECGPSVPIGDQAAIDHHRAAATASPILNCCSGKHAGFLTTARHLGVDTAGYIEPDHPVQQLVTRAIEELTGYRLGSQRPGRDGCGIPTYAIPLSGLAGSMSRLVTGEGLVPDFAHPARRLTAVPQGRQFWISGTGRHEVLLGEAIDEPLVAKIGAEGVFMVGLPDRGLGIALKVADGAPRACEAAVSATLAWLGVLDEEAVDSALRPGLVEDLRNKAGAVTGSRSVVIETPVLDRLS